VTDPDSTTSPFDSFDLTGFGTVWIGGQGSSSDRVDVEVSPDGGSTWTTIATDLAKGDAIPTPTNAAEVTAVRLTLHGVQGAQVGPGVDMSIGLKLALRDTHRSSGEPITK